MEGLGSRAWLKRQNARALRRLRTILERDPAAPQPSGVARASARRVTVAGG